MSKKSHPGDGTEHEGTKGGSIDFVAHMSGNTLHTLVSVFRSFFALRALLSK
jgi:hypothetical protein